MKYFPERLLSVNLVLVSIILIITRRFTATSLLYDQILVISLSVSVLISTFHFKKRKSFLNSLRICMVMFVFSIFTFSSTLLNIDRSRSIYVLSWVSNSEIKENSNGGIELSVKSGEASDKDAILQRVREHEKRGLVFKKNHVYRLSFTGDLVLFASKILAKVYNLEGWYINNH